MVRIQTVDLQPAGVTLLVDRVGIVIAQPHVCLSNAEPFRCLDAARPEALATIARTFEIARQATHGLQKTHFTVFPEYSIPGMDGFQLLEQELAKNEWPGGTVVIGGVHGLSATEYGELIGLAGSHFDPQCNGAEHVGQHEWVNCAVTWVKSDAGAVHRWIQPKLFPSWPEMNITCQEMFRGGSVYVFQGLRSDGTAYRFATVVCFDWIATLGDRKALDWILGVLHDDAPANAAIDLSWLFVIQRNQKPSHDTFLLQIAPFFDQTKYPRVRRGDACVVFANASGRADTGRADEFGGSSLVFSHEARFASAGCPLTFSNGGQKFRGSTLLSNYKDVFFRERGACIISFAQLNPRSLPAGPAGRALPIERAFVYSVSGAQVPRAPSGPVPACVKWLNDQLDVALGISGNHPHAALSPRARDICLSQVASLRYLAAPAVVTTVELASAAGRSETVGTAIRSSDDWDQTEEQGVAHVLCTANIVGLARPLEMDVPGAHGSFELHESTLDLVAVRGESHEDCIEHAKRFRTSATRRFLLVSRDKENSPWDEAYGSILQNGESKSDEDIRITEPAASMLHLSYQQLMDLFVHCPSPDDLRGGIDAQLSA